MPNVKIMNVAILNYEHALMSGVAGPYDMLSQVNGTVNTFRPDIKINEIKAEIVDASQLNNDITYDLVIIPAMHHEYLPKVMDNIAPLTEWLRVQYSNGAELASICLGAFILASTGLLDNKKATTHWLGADMFRTMFPKVKLLDDKIITDYQRIYTSGGAYSFTSLMIYLIDKFFGHEVAVLTSKVFLIHMNDVGQTSYNILNLQKSHSYDTIQKVQDHIESNLDSSLSIDDMVSLTNMTTRTFIRNFKKATGDTPYVYLQKVRVEKAKKLLEMKDMGIEQVCFEVGYSDFASFRKVFKKHAGINPSKYKKLYGKMQIPAHFVVE